MNTARPTESAPEDCCPNCGNLWERHLPTGGHCPAAFDGPAYAPPMNAEERARRAEILGQDLADALRLSARFFCAGPGERDSDDAQAVALRALLSLERWTAHRAALKRQGVPR